MASIIYLWEYRIQLGIYGYDARRCSSSHCDRFFFSSCARE